MSDLDLLDAFRADVAPAGPETRASARTRLLVAIASDGPRSRPARGRPRPRLVVAVLAILVGLLALPSLGLGSRLVDLVRPDAHRPPTVRQELVSAGYLYGHGTTPGVSQTIVAKERRLLEVSTERGRAVLWVAPTRDGGACFVMHGPRFKNGGCFGPRAIAHGLVPSLSGALGGRRSASIVGARWATLVGHAGRPASQVELRYADGSRSVLPFADGWFLFAVPALHRTAGHQPVALVSLDARGKVLVSQTRLFHPFASRH
jgi:hypothetical protein